MAERWNFFISSRTTTSMVSYQDWINRKLKILRSPNQNIRVYRPINVASSFDMAKIVIVFPFFADRIDLFVSFMQKLFDSNKSLDSLQNIWLDISLTLNTLYSLSGLPNQLEWWYNFENVSVNLQFDSCQCWHEWLKFPRFFMIFRKLFRRFRADFDLITDCKNV